MPPLSLPKSATSPAASPRPAPKPGHPFAELAGKRLVFRLKNGWTVTGTVVHFTHNLLRLREVSVKGHDAVVDGPWLLVDVQNVTCVGESLP